MAHRVNRARTWFALVLLLTGTLSGCGVADAGGTEPTPAELAGGSLASDFDLSGARSVKTPRAARTAAAPKSAPATGPVAGAATGGTPRLATRKQR